MNNQRIIDWVNELFAGFAQTNKVREQKEELTQHLIDRMKEYMAEGMNFDQAFAAAKEDLGDLDELLASFTDLSSSRMADALPAHEDRPGGWRFRLNHEGLVAMSPFVYLVLGFAFGWWAWAWVIIPMTAIIFSSGLFNGKGEDAGYGLIALSPFIYVLMGFFLGWWAWGWIIIPVSAILFGIPVIKIGLR
ncbi:MAG: permease prefix domain 1-containing protein [Defluviitaleaceae bacterium]|nr:permease prefix domain 1-containing protein [Defluviitaleaceae bacterium]